MAHLHCSYACNALNAHMNHTNPSQQWGAADVSPLYVDYSRWCRLGFSIISLLKPARRAACKHLGVKYLTQSNWPWFICSYKNQDKVWYICDFPSVIKMHVRDHEKWAHVCESESLCGLHEKGSELFLSELSVSELFMHRDTRLENTWQDENVHHDQMRRNIMTRKNF